MLGLAPALHIAEHPAHVRARQRPDDLACALTTHVERTTTGEPAGDAPHMRQAVPLQFGEYLAHLRFDGGRSAKHLTAPGFMRGYSFGDGPNNTLLVFWRTVDDAKAFADRPEHRRAIRHLYEQRWQYGLGASGIFSLPGTAPEDFVASPATSKAGFYVAGLATKAGHYAGRWLVAANGTTSCFGILGPRAPLSF